MTAMIVGAITGAGRTGTDRDVVRCTRLRFRTLAEKAK